MPRRRGSRTIGIEGAAPASSRGSPLNSSTLPLSCSHRRRGSPSYRTMCSCTKRSGVVGSSSGQGCVPTLGESKSGTRREEDVVHPAAGFLNEAQSVIHLAVSVGAARRVEQHEGLTGGEDFRVPTHRLLSEHG